MHSISGEMEREKNNNILNIKYAFPRRAWERVLFCELYHFQDK